LFFKRNAPVQNTTNKQHLLHRFYYFIPFISCYETEKFVQLGIIFIRFVVEETGKWRTPRYLANDGPQDIWQMTDPKISGKWRTPRYLHTRDGTPKEAMEIISGFETRHSVT